MRSKLLGAARQFAAALDAEDYEALASFLSLDCEYVTANGTLISPAPIIASYREAGTWVKASINSVTYESSVRVTPEGTAVVTFVDHLEHSGLRHVYSCEQSLSFDAEGKIHRIVHLDLPGQREAVDSFLQKIGVAHNVSPTYGGDG